jgi:hypothetical protein
MRASRKKSREGGREGKRERGVGGREQGREGAFIIRVFRYRAVGFGSIDLLVVGSFQRPILGGLRVEVLRVQMG